MKFVSLNIELLTLITELYTVIHLKALSSGEEPLQGQGHGSTFTYHHTPYKSTHFTP